MQLNADGSYTIEASADLEGVCERLGIEPEEDTFDEFATIAGYLCSKAGTIPRKVRPTPPPPCASLAPARNTPR